MKITTASRMSIAHTIAERHNIPLLRACDLVDDVLAQAESCAAHETAKRRNARFRAAMKAPVDADPFNRSLSAPDPESCQ